MLIIALLDLIFNIAFIFPALRKGYIFYNVFRYSYVSMQVTALCSGLAFGCSLASDLCTLWLTAERYAIVCKNISTGYLENKRLLLSAVCIIIGVSLSRFIRFGFHVIPFPEYVDEDGQLVYSDEYSPVYYTAWFKSIIYASDFILPFLLLILMLYFSVKIAIVVIKRSKIHETASIQQQLEIQKQSSAALLLLVILMSLYLMNQIGYCLYAVSILIRAGKTVNTSSSTLEEAIDYVKSSLFVAVSALISDILECLARSANFYLYILFSESIRNAFRRKIRCEA